MNAVPGKASWGPGGPSRRSGYRTLSDLEDSQSLRSQSARSSSQEYFSTCLGKNWVGVGGGFSLPIFSCAFLGPLTCSTQNVPRFSAPFRIRRRNTIGKQAVQSDKGIQNVKIYSYKELRDATQGFSPANKVGEGGFGPVYKGKLKDGTIAALKVLSYESRQGAQEFLTEITVISDIVHENLVSLYGCCVEGDHRILVYNYLENNSLAQTLLGSRQRDIQFSWRTRSQICIGVARGLAFLHEEVRPHIVHRDIKASNILLDKDLTPKISDFGLAKLLSPNMTHVSTRVAGTMGYLAPEYAIRGQLTRKADIYSFGVLLLEIVSGRSNTNTGVTGLHSEDQFLLEGYNAMPGNLVWQTWALYQHNELAKIIDTSLDGDLDAEEACGFLKVGLLCTQEIPKLRPSMSIVVRMLTGERAVNSETITEPGLISDFWNLKVRNQEKGNEPSSSAMSGMSQFDDSALSSKSTQHASKTLKSFTTASTSVSTISDRDY